MKKCLWLLLALAACASPTADVRVAAAANVQFALDSIVTVFEKETNYRVDVVLGSSGKLTAQIEQGAPYDIFLSADQRYSHTLYTSLSLPQEPATYAYGQLAFWMHQSPRHSSQLQWANPPWQHIAVANPRTAPYGVAAMAVLDSLSVRQQWEPKLVYGESIAQVNQYITTHAVEAAFTSQSIAFATPRSLTGAWMSIPDSLHPPIVQTALLLSPSPTAAQRAFYDFLFANQARNIWAAFGYKAP